MSNERPEFRQDYVPLAFFISFRCSELGYMEMNEVQLIETIIFMEDLDLDLNEHE